eukprot:scaffold16813_cov21-Tisochrysis_lutea.AAC.9
MAPVPRGQAQQSKTSFTPTRVRSGSTGENLKEAQAINKSLSALGDVISALASEQPHIPYRNHKLTMLMSDSLGVNERSMVNALGCQGSLPGGACSLGPGEASAAACHA